MVLNWKPLRCDDTKSRTVRDPHYLCLMHSKIPATILILLFAATVAGAQIRSWTKVNTGDLQCDFPVGYKSATSGISHSIYYDGENMLLTVTAIADTFPMKGNLDRDYSRDFAEVVLATSRKINGRVREYRDTVIGNMPGYISRQEIRLQGGDKAYYDLVQVLHQDSIRAFSSQFVAGDKSAAEASARLFSSIRYVLQGQRKATRPRTVYWGVGGLLVLGAVFAVFRWSKLRKH